jgi:alpha-L-arabinofuranosidase
MSSYAPLFVNVNPGGMQWEANLIGYDAMTSYGSPSYYAQAMFAEYLGSEVPVSTLTGAGQRFFYSVTQDSAKGTVYLKVVNANSTPQPLNIELSGASKIAGTGTLVTLNGVDPAETNTISAPTRIVPVKTELKGVGSSISHTVPPYTVQVLEISTK